MKGVRVVWLFFIIALALAGFFAINGSDESTRAAGATYFFMVLAVLLAWNIAIWKRIF